MEWFLSKKILSSYLSLYFQLYGMWFSSISTINLGLCGGEIYLVHMNGADRSQESRRMLVRVLTL